MGLFSSISKAIKRATSGSSGSSSSSSKSGGSSSSKSNSPNKSIAEYKADYNKAYATRDYTGMRAANDGANAIRTATGQSTYSSAVGDLQRANNYNPYATDKTYNIQGVSDTNSTTSGNYDIQDKINALNEAKRQSTMDGLTKARDNALSSLDERKSSLEPYYYNKRNQAAAQSDVSTMNFAQYMAGRGVSGNSAAMPEIYRNANLQNQIGALNQQQASDVASIEKDKSNLETNYQSDLAAAQADAQATALQNYITQMNADRAYNTDKTATAKSDYANTLGAFSNNYQSEIDKIDALINTGKTIDTDGVSLAYKRNLLKDKQNEKIAEQQAKAATAEQDDPSYATALQAYNKGIRTAQVLRVLGLPQ
ncbi:MAG: hypothetical protein AB9836_05930 [Aminipila sp.]